MAEGTTSDDIRTSLTKPARCSLLEASGRILMSTVVHRGSSSFSSSFSFSTNIFAGGTPTPALLPTPDASPALPVLLLASPSLLSPLLSPRVVPLVPPPRLSMLVFDQPNRLLRLMWVSSSAEQSAPYLRMRCHHDVDSWAALVSRKKKKKCSEGSNERA